MGSYLSISDKEKETGYDKDFYNYGDWSLTPETTLTETTLNIPKKIFNDVNENLNTMSKDINYGLSKSYNTLSETTEDIFLSINKGLKNLLDLSADSIDYAMDKLGLYSNSTLTNSSISTDYINNLPESIKQKLLNETTSISSNNPTEISATSYSTDYINNLPESIKQKLLNETTSTSSNNPTKISETSYSIDYINNLPESIKQKLLNETTSTSSNNPIKISETSYSTDYINNLPESIKQKLLNETTSSLNNPSEMKEINDISDTTNISLSKINEYINSPTSQIKQIQKEEEFNDKTNEILILSQEISNSQSKDNITQQLNKQPKNSTTSSMNTSQLSTLNLNGGNISSINLSRF